MLSDFIEAVLRTGCEQVVRRTQNELLQLSESLPSVMESTLFYPEPSRSLVFLSIHRAHEMRVLLHTN